MPVPTKTDEFLDLVRKSDLVPATRLEAFVKRHGRQLGQRSPRDLADLLLNEGLITQFQAEQFLQGKWRGFTLGKYRVLERIGSGGMGTVYLCMHTVVGRKVAVKVLPTSQAHNPSALGRFYREARAAGVLDHPNLVKAHDIDQDGDLHFLVMDYVDGTSLQDLIANFGPLPVERAAHYIRQAARGLTAAHEAGLIHRDIKPGNIMLERNGTIRVLDLGLARFFDDNTDPLTLKYDENNVLGTADYVAPEQALDSHEVDIRADIYSLGATFYFLLAGQPPFPGGKVAQKLIWHQVRQPTSIRQLRTDVPESLAMVLNTMMAKNPDHRYQTPLAVEQALAPWTARPLAPPRNEEMPTLCPALTISSLGMPGQRTQAHLPTIGKGTRTQQCERVVGFDAPNPSEAATPRALASDTPTEIENLKAHQPARMTAGPSPLLKRTAQAAGKESTVGWGASLLLLLGLGLLGAVAGVGLTWWVLGR